MSKQGPLNSFHLMTVRSPNMVASFVCQKRNTKSGNTGGFPVGNPKSPRTNIARTLWVSMYGIVVLVLAKYSLFVDLDPWGSC